MNKLVFVIPIIFIIFITGCVQKTKEEEIPSAGEKTPIAEKEVVKEYLESIIAGNWNKVFQLLVDVDTNSYSDECEEKFKSAFGSWVGSNFSLGIGEVGNLCIRTLETPINIECKSVDFSLKMWGSGIGNLSQETWAQVVKPKDEWKVQLMCAGLPSPKLEEIHNLIIGKGYGYDPSKMQKYERELSFEVTNQGNITYTSDKYTIRLFCASREELGEDLWDWIEWTMREVDETKIKAEKWYLSKWDADLKPNETMEITHKWTAPGAGEYGCWFLFEEILTESPLTTEIIKSARIEIEIAEPECESDADCTQPCEGCTADYPKCFLKKCIECISSCKSGYKCENDKCVKE